MYSADQNAHRDGHKFGDRNKRTSQGNGMRKRGSFKIKNKKLALSYQTMTEKPLFIAITATMIGLKYYIYKMSKEDLECQFH